MPFSYSVANLLIDDHQVNTHNDLESQNKQQAINTALDTSVATIKRSKTYSSADEKSTSPRPRQPSLLTSSSYPTTTSLSSNATSVQKGDKVLFQSQTKWYLFGWTALSEGNIIYYDLNELVNDKANFAGTFSNYTKIAGAFTVPITTTFEAFALNLSNCANYIDNLDVVFYLATDLTNYQSNYLMRREISFYTYHEHQNNLDSPILFVFYDHPLSEINSNVLQPGQTYYAILDSPANLNVQYSLDSAEKDDNGLWIYDGSSWIEQSGLDLQFGIYTGTNLTEIPLDSNGQTSFVLDTNTISGFEHTIVASYYSMDNYYAVSDDFCDLQVIDLSAPADISLVASSSVQYSDSSELIATVTNMYSSPIENASVSFYYSTDNSTWIFDAEVLTDSEGRAVHYHLIDQSSGTIYFKAESDTTYAFASTDCTQEIAIATAPEIQAVYGSKAGSATISTFQLQAIITDDDNTPIEGATIHFYMDGLTLPIVRITNATGQAITGDLQEDWSVGLYTSVYWFDVFLDNDNYLEPSRTYGNIRILPNTLSLSDLSAVQSVWNQDTTIAKRFIDAEGDDIPNLSVSISIYNPQTGASDVLGLYITNSSGYVSFTIPGQLLGPGDYEIHFVPNSANYEAYEGVVPLQVLPDQQLLTIYASQNDNYTYGTALQLDIVVTDQLSSPLDNVSVYIYLSYPNLPGIWLIYYHYYTNASGWLTVVLDLDYNAGENFEILISTEDYAIDGVVYSTAADPEALYYLCISAPLSFEALQNINTTNQQNVSISGYLYSNGYAVVNYTVSIEILGRTFNVSTDINGYFELVYFVDQGGEITVSVIANSDSNYDSVTEQITIYADPCAVTIETSDIRYVGEGQLTFEATVTSEFNTTPDGIKVEFWYYNGSDWSLFGSSFTNASGVAILTVNETLPLGDYQWKAYIAPSANWLGTEQIRSLQIGLHTSIVLDMQISISYGETIAITIYVTDQYGQPISINVDIFLNLALLDTITTNSSGIAVYYWTANVVPGDHTIKAQLVEGNYYQSSSYTQAITVTKAESNIYTSGDIAITYNSSRTLQAYLYSPLGAIVGEEINIYIDHVFNASLFTNSSGWINWLIPNMVPGTYTILLDFAGSQYYFGCNTSISLIIEKIQSSLDVNAPNSYYTSNYQITGQLLDNSQEPLNGFEVSLYINDSYVEATVTDDFGSFTFSIDLLPGDYKIDIELAETIYVTGALYTTYIHIWQLTSTLVANVHTNSTSMTINGTLYSDSTPIVGAEIIIYLNGSLQSSVYTNENGYFELLIDNVTPAVYNIDISYSGSQIYKQSSMTIVVEQNKLQTELIINTLNGTYKTQPATIEVLLTSQQTPLSGELINININGDLYSAFTNSTGDAVFELSMDLAAGTYSVEVTFSGSEIYSSNTQFTSIQVYKAASNIDVSIDYATNTLFGALIGVENLASQTLSIFANQTLYANVETTLDGTFNLVLDLVPGVYIITVYFDGSANYLASERSITIEIAKVSPIISASEYQEIVYGEEHSINISLTSITGEPIVTDLSVIIDGAAYGSLTTDSNGIATLVLPSLSPGNHSIIVEFQGDSYYLYKQLKISVVIKSSLEIDVSAVDGTEYGTSAIISGTISGAIPSYDLVTLQATINNQSFSITILDDGSWQLILPATLPAGNYSLKLAIEDNGYVYETMLEVSLLRSPAIFSIELDTNSHIFNDDTAVNGTITFAGTALEENISLDIYLDDILVLETYTATGYFSLPSDIFALTPGTYNLTIVAVSNNSNFQDVTLSIDFAIEKDNITVTIETIDTPQAGTRSSIRITLTDSTGQALPNYHLNITIDNISYAVQTNDSGQAVVAFIPYHAGISIITLYGKTTAFYTSLDFETTIDVEKGETSIAVSTTQVLYNASDGIIITLTAPEMPINQAELTIMLNEQYTFVGITDNQGQYRLVLADIPSGNYSLLIAFNGTEDFLESHLLIELTINPQPTTLALNYENNSIIFVLLDSENRTIAGENVFISAYNSEGVSIWNKTVTTLDGLTIVELPNDVFDESIIIKLAYSGSQNFISTEATISIAHQEDKGSSTALTSNETIIILSLVGLVGLFGAGEIVRKLLL